MEVTRREITAIANIGLAFDYLAGPCESFRRLESINSDISHAVLGNRLPLFDYFERFSIVFMQRIQAAVGLERLWVS